jgi:pseudouridine kinase
MSDAIWLVAGGQNIDLIATARQPFHLSDSTPGDVVERAGGVAFNIARNLALLTRPVYFLSVRGDDAVGLALDSIGRESNLELDHVLVRTDLSTSRYIAINDETGDMVAAINDMTAMESLEPRDVENWCTLASAPCREVDSRPMHPCAAVIDANLPEDVIVHLANEWGIPIFVDAVSQAKVDRLKPVFHRLAGLKLNRVEAERLTGHRIASIENAVKAIHQLLASGIERICLSLGAEGALFADGRQTVATQYDCVIEKEVDGRIVKTTSIINTTGAGDAMCAVFAWATISGHALDGAARLSQAAASLALESPGAVNEAMTIEALERRAASPRLTVQVI